jgi:hypothetical protein
MKTFVRYIYDSTSLKLFLEWELLQTTFVERIKRHILCSKTFPQKSVHLWDNVQKCTTGQATDDDVIGRIRFACWMIKATDKHSEHLILTTCPPQKCKSERSSMLRAYVYCLYYFVNWFVFLLCEIRFVISPQAQELRMDGGENGNAFPLL